MKAKEYVERYKEEGETLEALSNVYQGMIAEFKEISDSRNSKTLEAFLSIYDELNNKWKVFARKVDGVRLDGFEEMTAHLFPELYGLISMARKKREIRAYDIRNRK